MLQKLRSPLASTEAERESERQYDPRQQDEKSMAHDVAADLHVFERNQHDEGKHRILREPSEDVAILYPDGAAVRHDGSPDKAREVGSEGQDHERDHETRHEHDDLAEQIGDVVQTERIERK